MVEIKAIEVLNGNGPLHQRFRQGWASAVNVAAPLPDNLGIGQSCAQSIHWRGRAVSLDLGGTAAHHLGVESIGTDHGQLGDRGGIERQNPVVAQQHRTGRRGTTNQGPVLGSVQFGLGEIVVVVQRARTFHQCQDVCGDAIKGVGGHLTVVDRSGEQVAIPATLAGHLQTQPGVRHVDCGTRPEPVGHHETVKTPLLTQHGGEQPMIVRTERAVEPVIGRHDPPRTAIFDGVLEGHQIQFAQGSLIDLGVDAVAFKLRIVAHKVFGGCSYATRLHTPHKSCSQTPRKDRILAERLKIASAFGGTVQVDCGSQQHL